MGLYASEELESSSVSNRRGTAHGPEILAPFVRDSSIAARSQLTLPVLKADGLPGDLAQKRVELWERHRRRTGVVDRRLTITSQGRHRERHGDPVVAERIEAGGAEDLLSGNP